MHGRERFPNFVDDCESLLTENRIFKQRTVDIGVITAEQAVDLGFHGPQPARRRRSLGPAQGPAL